MDLEGDTLVDLEGDTDEQPLAHLMLTPERRPQATLSDMWASTATDGQAQTPGTDGQAPGTDGQALDTDGQAQPGTDGQAQPGTDGQAQQGTDGQAQQGKVKAQEKTLSKKRRLELLMKDDDDDEDIEDVDDAIDGREEGEKPAGVEAGLLRQQI